MDVKPNIKLTFPFFMVSDMETSLRFYVDKLGFALTRQWIPNGKIEWCWLQREGAAIMLQQPRTKADTQQNGKGVSVCYQCEDALALYHEFTQRGVEIKEPFVGNNMWVVAFTDPDGYKLDFESPTDVPEETTHTEWKTNS